MDLTFWSLALHGDFHRGEKNCCLSLVFTECIIKSFSDLYLGNCSKDVAHEIAKELQAKPDLIIGNYSEGNLVASLLAHKLGVTQVYGAHV